MKKEKTFKGESFAGVPAVWTGLAGEWGFDVLAAVFWLDKPNIL